MSIDVSPFLHMAARMAQAGHLDIARETVSDILARQPDNIEAYRLLAKIEFGLDNVPEGIEHFRTAISLTDKPAELHYELGTLLAAQNQMLAAAEEIGRAVELEPWNPDYLYNLGCAFSAIEMNEPAVDAFRRVFELAPQYARAHQNLGYSLLSLAAWADASQAFEEALKLTPDSQECMVGLGVALRGEGRDAEADALIERLSQGDNADKALLDLATFEMRRSGGRDVIELLYDLHRKDPDAPDPLIKLSIALERVGRIHEVGLPLIKCAMSHPDNGMLMCMAGVAAVKMGEIDEQTESVLLRGYSLLPDNAAASNALGSLHFQRGDVEKAVEWYYRAHLIKPVDPTIYSNLLFTLRHTEILTPEELFVEHKRFGEIHEALIQPLPQRPVEPEDATRRLRVGFVSPDLCRHVVMMFFEPYLDTLDREKFEVFAYYTNGYEDKVSERVKEKVDGWRNVSALRYEDAAQLIQDDKIDILIDLAGHTAKNGLIIFVYKPAPVQMTWIGYPSTTGLTRIDYRLTERGGDSGGEAIKNNTEKLLFLDGGSTFRPPADSPDVAPPPMLQNGFITFGSLNKALKISDDALTAWARILKRVPNSRLLMVVSSDELAATQQRIYDRFSSVGVAPERLVMTGRVPLHEFLTRMGQVDIALDPFPYSGGTTSWLTLWMGVPMIALRGSDSISRAGYGVLTAARVPDLAAPTIDGYIDTAVALANDPDRLLRLRAELRGRLLLSPPMQEGAAGDRLEKALLYAWRNYLSTAATADAEPAVPA